MRNDAFLFDLQENNIVQWTFAENFKKLIILISCFVFREIAFKFLENVAQIKNLCFAKIS